MGEDVGKELTETVLSPPTNISSFCLIVRDLGETDKEFVAL